jgi:hypothetical protein
MSPSNHNIARPLTWTPGTNYRNTPWYEDDDNMLFELENSLSHGITNLMGHQLEDGIWEYAIVHWWYGSCTPIVLFHNGKVVPAHN